MKALYRKYRPTKITDVIGQKQVTKPLSSALKSGNFSHSYLFTGPRGCGKTSVARIFAHEVNQFPYTVEDSYTDIIEIDAASNTGVDNIRDLREKAAIAPSKGKYKVYIIDEVHMLSKSAFNALLKTLEEPPKHVIFIMATTDAYKVPITITSRAQVYNFQLASPDVMLNHLKNIAEKEKINITDDALGVIVARGGGSFRDSISLLDQISTLKDEKNATIEKTDVEQALGLPEDENCIALLEAYQSADTAKIVDLLKSTLNSGVKPEILAENLIKKIIDNPQSTLLSLLAKLPDVKAPFTEAKILLAFLGEGVRTLPVASGTATLGATTSITIPTPAPKPPIKATKLDSDNQEYQTAIPRPSAEKTPETASKASKTTSETSETTSEAPKATSGTPETFNWETYLGVIRDVNLGIAATLSKCSYKFENNALTVIAERKIHKTILSSANNQKVLQKFLPEGITLEIGDASEITASSKEFGKISDIMGNVTEVRSDGVPF